MILTTSFQIDQNELSEIEFDVAYFACGYEERATFIKKTYLLKSNINNVLVFRDEKRLNTLKNKEYYKKDNTCNFIISEGESDIDIINSLNLFFQQNTKDEVNILIDYSSMTSVWFATFLNYFNCFFRQGMTSKVNLFYAYSHSIYTNPVQEDDVTLSVDPLNGFSNISIPDKPTALIIGLGYEKKKATGLAQYLDAESYVFYSDSSYAEKFSYAVKSENATLLSEVKKENVFEYPILNIGITANILHTLIVDLVQSCRIVLAPCGPKIFSLLCLIESIKVENTDVWRISSSKASRNVVDKKADGKVSIYRVSFEC